jgi:hypothetical protein
MKRLLVALTAVTAMAVAGPSYAADGFTLSGTATVHGNTVQFLSDFSDNSTANDFGAISFPVSSGATLATLTTLSSEFNVTNDNCGGGSPRFQITIGGKNVFVYLGPAPSFNTCPTGWISSGNLVGTSDQCRVDTSQLIAGTQCTTWAAAVAALGAQPITAIQLVVDGGWSQPDKEQTVHVRNVTINGQTFPRGKPKPPAEKVNPAKLCKAERTRLGAAAFNELWGTNGNDKNAFGKCVSTMAHAKNAGQTQQQILAAIAACKAKGLSGAPLGACVAAKDRVAATKTEAQEKAKTRKKKP